MQPTQVIVQSRSFGQGSPDGQPRRPAWRRILPALRISTRLPAILLLVWPALGHAQSAKVAASTMAIATSQGTARVIVHMTGSTVPEGALTVDQRHRQREAIATTQSALMGDLGGTSYRVMRAYQTIPFVALEASPGALAALERSGRVSGVEQDRTFHPVLGYDTTLVEADQAWAAGFDGTGWAVAILDTGVDGTHPMLTGKVISESCFSTGGNCPDGSTQELGPGSAVPCTYATDGCGHGTYVSGIAAGNWASQDLMGVARGASIVAVQIFSRFTGASNCSGEQEDPCAEAYSSDIIAGLERIFVLAPSFNIAAVNLSLGGQVFTSQSACDAANGAAKAAIDNLASLGIATVIASGNDSNATGVAEPGCISSAISVGSTNATDQVSSFSDSASFLSLLAPGENITSAFPGGEAAIGSGTSGAAPHVSGAFAVLREKMPSASVTAIESALQSTGVPITDSRNGVTTPRIRVLEALDAIGGTTTRASGVQITPDQKRTLISKDVGNDRWAIVYNHDDNTVTGNVFPSNGGDPQFVWCQRTGDDGNPDPAKIQITFACYGASRCTTAPCDASQWTFIQNSTLPGSFFQAP